MTEEEFLDRWNQERPIYERWGAHVAHCLVGSLNPLIAPLSTELFIKLPVQPRLKTGGSLLTKAFYNSKKTYQRPFDEITDKVGVRLVVLLASQISKVEAAVEQCPVWNFSKDKDYELEIAASPSAFEYQSVHYVIRNKADLDLDGLVVPAGTPCEIQIRTMLQHAHSELTHDTIYKPSVEKTLEMERAVSKAMALIEATNDYFEDVAARIERLVSSTRKLTEELGFIYREKVGIQPEITKAESLLIEAFGNDALNLLPDLMTFLDSKTYISERIAARSKTKLLFRQPSILLVYKAASERPRETRGIWPLTPNELAPIYADLGIAFQGD
jgi:putative GTP pyrophosphokinase